MENNFKNPWLGLESYKEGEVLYGRDEDIRDLTQCVLNDVDTLLYGKSGIGKSSILNAGIIPAARRHGYMPILIRLSHKAEHSYLYQINNAIASAMIPVVYDEHGNQTTLSAEDDKKRDEELELRIKSVVRAKDAEKETIYEYFHRHTFHGADGERIKLLLIFDQFEEIFTLQTNENKKKRFFSELADFLNDVMPRYLQQEAVVPESNIQEEVKLAEDGNLDDLFDDLNLRDQDSFPEYVMDNDIHLVFTIREDFLSEFEYYSASIPSLKQNRYGLRPINEEQASQIIMRPMPGLIQEPVAKLIIEKVTGRADFELDGVPEIEVDSAVLSLYLNRLYDAKVGSSITAELVEEKGGEIISDFYNEAICDISDSAVEYLEDMLLNGQGRRDNITIFDAINDGNISEDELDILCNKRKILRQFNYAGDLRIEYVHDILCPIVKEHKDDRNLIKQQEEDRRKQEQLLLEEKAKRERIEKEAEEEKRRLQEEAKQSRKRNRRRMYAVSSVLCLLLFGIGIYWWYYVIEHESYYASFERINGWPQGVGDELSLEERNQCPLYYKLSHKGRLPHDTDVEILSSNGALPLSPRLSVLEISDEDTDDVKAKNYYDLLSRVTRIHFVEGENNKIDKEIAIDKDGNTLFIISYFHLPNGKEAWAQYVTATGQAMSIRDNGIDRVKLSWYANVDNQTDINNGRIESFTYFDANRICRPISGGIGGFVMRFPSPNTISRYVLDEYGRLVQSQYNMVTTRMSGDTVEISYARVRDLDASAPQLALGPKGYVREVTVKDQTYLYGLASEHPLASVHLERDKFGNIVKRVTEGEQYAENPATIIYTYAPGTGYLIGVEKYDQNNNRFAYAQDSIYKQRWEYTQDGELVLEEYWNVHDEKIYYHIISQTESVKTDLLCDERVGFYQMKVDSIFTGRTVTCYYGKNNEPVVYKALEGQDSLSYHKIVTKDEDGKKFSYYYIVDNSGNVVPCPKILGRYGKAMSFFCKEQCFDKDGNLIYYILYDENGAIIKSMMYYYLNGQRVSRAVMGVDGYGNPVRCPNWEEEGYAYYKIYWRTDFNDDINKRRIVSATAVDEWDNMGVLYDASDKTYITITYKDYQGADISLNGEHTTIYDSYSQYSFGLAENITDVHVPYLHILDKQSSMYKAGLRDGDRIVRFGSWAMGMSTTELTFEWNNAVRNMKSVTVLRPTASAYEEIQLQLKRDSANNEEFHVFALTNEEYKMFKEYNTNKK